LPSLVRCCLCGASSRRCGSCAINWLFPLPPFCVCCSPRVRARPAVRGGFRNQLFCFYQINFISVADPEEIYLAEGTTEPALTPNFNTACKHMFSVPCASRLLLVVCAACLLLAQCADEWHTILNDRCFCFAPLVRSVFGVLACRRVPAPRALPLWHRRWRHERAGALSAERCPTVMLD
jgi:hypothetical protein